MERVTLTIKNYRNIPASVPLSLVIEDGISFILGPNNVGKSNLLRLFYELRLLFGSWASSPGAGTHGFSLSNLFFDSIRNQKSAEPVVRLSVQSASCNCDFILKAKRDDPHTNEVSAIAVRGNPWDPHVFGRLVQPLAKTMYVGPIRSHLFQAQLQTDDVQCGNEFVKTWDDWANGENVNRRGQIRQLIEELKELFAFKNFGIRVSKKTQTLLLETDDGDFKLEELGSGLSHFVVVLGNVLFKRPSLLLIDEPENGLHPKMQELFVRSLASKCENGLIATSHAVGLARSVGDRLFVITREANGPVFQPFGEHNPLTLSQSISELGYSQFAQLGAQHLLLVEGRTEIKSFREILRKYGIEQHFLIWSLGGAQFITGDDSRIAEELHDLKRLNTKSISVIIDSERTAPDASLSASFTDFLKLCAQLGFNTFATDRHSTENYITQSSLDKVLGNKYRALGPHEKFGASAEKWSKNHNWRMFLEMSRSDFRGTGLDTFITNTLVPLAQGR